MTDVSSPIPVVRLIVRDADSRVLILRRHGSRYGNGAWCLPGGKVDFGESVQEAVVKELLEETALQCRKASFLFYQDSLPSAGSDMHCVNLYFEVDAAGEMVLNEESDAAEWITAGDLSRFALVFRNDEGLRRYWAQS